MRWPIVMAVLMLAASGCERWRRVLPPPPVVPVSGETGIEGRKAEAERAAETTDAGRVSRASAAVEVARDANAENPQPNLHTGVVAAEAEIALANLPEPGLKDRAEAAERKAAQLGLDTARARELYAKALGEAETLKDESAKLHAALDKINSEWNAEMEKRKAAWEAELSAARVYADEAHRLARDSERRADEAKQAAAKARAAKFVSWFAGAGVMLCAGAVLMLGLSIYGGRLSPQSALAAAAFFGGGLLCVAGAVLVDYIISHPYLPYIIGGVVALVAAGAGFWAWGLARKERGAADDRAIVDSVLPAVQEFKTSEKSAGGVAFDRLAKSLRKRTKGRVEGLIDDRLAERGLV